MSLSNTLMPYGHSFTREPKGLIFILRLILSSMATIDICDMLSTEPDTLGITSGKYVAFRGDPAELSDKDLLAAIKPTRRPENI